MGVLPFNFTSFLWELAPKYLCESRLDLSASHRCWGRAGRPTEAMNLSPVPPMQWQAFFKVFKNATQLYKVIQTKLNPEKVLKLRLVESLNDDLCQKLAPSLFIDHLFGWGLFLNICPDQLQQGKVL